jgi:hypothetical protein
MKKKRSTTAVLPFAAIRVRYLRKLQSFRASDPMIKLILRKKNLEGEYEARDQCAALFWNCVNDVPARLAGISARRRNFWAAQYATAIRGADALALIARENDNPAFAELMLGEKQAVLVLQQRLPAAIPAPQARGRAGRDWSAVLYAKRMLEGHLDGEQLPDSTVATLLDVAEEIAGTGKTVTKNAVRLGLARLKEHLPAVEDTLSKFYPRGEKFPPRERSQLHKR